MSAAAWVFLRKSTDAEDEKPPDGALGEVLTPSSTIRCGESSVSSSPFPRLSSMTLTTLNQSG
jgi:hypothetical protein